MSPASADIYAAIRKRYCAPEWAIFFEVANGTGSYVRRYSDAVAMNLFPSRGLTLHGIEVKVSRSDWLRELKNPHKVEQSVFKYVDHWWVVAPERVVEKAELPKAWGLMELRSGDLRQVIAAPRLEPVELNRPFIAALLRRASDADAGAIDKIVQKRLSELRERDKAELDRRIKGRLEEVEKKIDKVRAIEDRLGLSLTDWRSPAGVDRIIKAIDATGIASQWSNLRNLSDTLGNIKERLDKHIAEFDAAAGPLTEAAE